MRWQERLRRLDVELASGNINHDEHRRQREEILAAVSSSGVPDEPTASNSSEEKSPESTSPPAQPVSPGQDPDPPSNPGDSDGTTSNGNNGSNGNRSGADHATGPTVLLNTPWQTTAPSPADTELTSPLSAVRDLTEPPLLPQRTDGPMVPESRGRVPTWLLLTLAVLVAVGAVGGGAWFLTDMGQNTTAGHASAASDADERDPTLAERLPDLPGRPSPQNATMTVDRGADLGLYSETDARTMKQNGADEIIYRSSAEGPDFADGYTVIAIQTPSRENADHLTEQLTRTVLTQGFTSVPMSGREGIRVLNRTDGTGRVSVIWYVSGRTAVGVGVSQAVGSSQNTLRARLVSTLKSVESALPVNK